MTAPGPAVLLNDLTHHYGQHPALQSLSFSVPRGTIFGLLGPNGGGKTTLFRLLCTLLPVQQGQLEVCGFDLRTQAEQVRRQIGVTFQSPSLDPQLTVEENLRHQAHLYGLSGRLMRERISDALEIVGMLDRRADRAESLSGGMQRRVEIAKGLLHQPQVLILDEPSTGLDPGARRELWTNLERLRDVEGVTILVTTHILEEAEHCNQLAILDRGRLVASGTPAELRASVGGDCLTIQSPHPSALARQIADRFTLEPQQVGSALRIEHPQGHELLRDLVAAFPDEIESVALGKPTLEDVFIARTGHRFDESTDGIEFDSPASAKRH